MASPGNVMLAPKRFASMQYGEKMSVQPVASGTGSLSPLEWYFPSTDGGDDDGFNDSLRETFEGKHEHYVARECIQNSLDARADQTEPVTVVFERGSLATSNIPDRQTLIDTLEAARDFSVGQERAGDFYDKALELLSEPTLEVLRIGDYNTTGLDGQDNDSRGGWYRLVRTSGSNSAHGAGGGSFGIGKGAPFAASELHTVFYSTVNSTGGAAFQGKARLSSFVKESDVRRGIGQLGIGAATRGVGSVRELSAIPSDFRRAEQGTDVFILAYKTPAADWCDALLKSVIENFWAAIYFGDLEVNFVQQGQVEPILSVNKQNLRQTFDNTAGLELYRPYFDAVADRDRHFTGNLPEIGDVSLYVKKNPSFPRKVQMMRLAKMKVYDRPTSSLSDSYAGVFICESPEGNALLRRLEPPAHDKWDPNRLPAQGPRTMRRIGDWIRQQLKSMSSLANSEPEDIPELSQYLPENDSRQHQTGLTGGVERTQDQQEIESGSESEMAHTDGTVTLMQPRKRELTPLKPPSGGEGRGGKGGSGGDRSKGGSKAKRTRTQRNGEVAALLDPEKLVFRSREVIRDGRRLYQATIHPDASQTGALSLIAIGEAGELGIDIQSAIAEDGTKFSTDGPLILDVPLVENVPLRLLITLESKRRYALGVG
jgi:hypothetical protein